MTAPSARKLCRLPDKRSEKGVTAMKSRDKFEGCKNRQIAENEKKHGKEIRQKYGDETVDASNAKFRNMSREKMQEAQTLSEAIDRGLEEAFAEGDPAGEKAQAVCALHKQWLCLYWPEGLYSKKAHAALADTYVEDQRFRVYYDKIAPGCAEFLRDAIAIYCAE